ncbi:ACP S-malonyltransferase [Acholeplasma equirhinis]|uniref:ACP S-malonyltransferase n=1 Tax=Acholeplasma equirhinis TaxID=555393 RepID=UPI00197ABA75|nr:ACP S-malonyltransferase [Acholeplasma equirhinis]MBN3490191.1 ACP S-malonyltransferase [Acholeplasma equirhinis]
MKLAVLFSGQGAQFVGMGLDFIENVPELKKRMDTFSKATNLHLQSLLVDETKINDTRYTQPLMVAVEILIHDYLKEAYGLKVDGYLGFSLGEFSALYAAGYFSDIEIMKIIKMRAELMADAGQNTFGKMAAILGLSDQDVEVVCEEASLKDSIVVAANYNSPGQLVISGESDAVLRAVELAKSKGARRAILLNVSGAFHSPYMKDAGKKLRQFATGANIQVADKPVYANSNARVLKQSEILDELETQIKSPVYFKQSIEKMVQDGYSHFLEVGPGTVLSNLVKKINPELKVYNVSSYEDIQNIKEIL